MDAREIVRLAGRSLRGHKLRSALTIIGIVIGIAAVVTFVTLGASLKADIVGEIDQSTANNVYVLSTPGEDQGFPDRPQAVFTENDLETLRGIEGVQSVVPQGTIAISSLTLGNETIARQQLTATTPAAFDRAVFRSGRAFEADASEVVINDQARTVFERNLTVGDNITVGLRGNATATVTVVGVVNRTGSQLPFQTFAAQPRFYVPAQRYYETTVQSPTLPGNPRQQAYPQVTVVANPATLTATQERVGAALNGTDAAQLQPQGYTLTARTSGDIADGLADLVDRLTRFVTGLALISLVVGAIGIANIMLVSVTERTREIGIMKSVGGGRRDILLLFLSEAALLGGIGAIVAIPVGLAGGYVVTSYAEIGMTLAPVWFGVAIGVGVLVGIVAGLYPAWRAARVDPIDALRYE